MAAEAAKLPRRITAAVAELPVGTLVTLEQHRSLLDLRPRWLALARLSGRLAAIERRSGRLTIVAAALIRDGTVLIGCRNHPAELAGRWEFPGGKAERGETPAGRAGPRDRRGAGRPDRGRPPNWPATNCATARC